MLKDAPPTEACTKSQLEPIQLLKDSSFCFRCHKGLACYTKCCSGIDIILTPYDVIRLKNRLELSSSEFLSIYTKPEILNNYGLPVATLKMINDTERTCPFVREDGCLVYTDRPASCRYYPLGLANTREQQDSPEQFYFFVKEEHCLGFQEKDEWTVEDWRQNQGVDIYDTVNKRWMEFAMRARSFSGRRELTEKSREMFFMASYDIERFRRFVFESSFLKRYNVPLEMLEKAKESEVELFQLGCEWLNCAFFEIGEIQPRQLKGKQ
ncbi:MAG: YkgJ family cysteine cluster protein [Pseudomonadota bacterium]